MSELETGSADVAGNPAESVNNVTPPDGGEPVVKVNAPGVNTDPAPDLSWMDALSDEEKAFAGNKAWKTPQHILESYRNLEKHLGANRAYECLAGSQGTASIKPILGAYHE